jgi:thiosulfate reductase cytochrome b subunit
MAKIYVHPLPVRIWHWINALGFVLMILSGVQIRYIGLIDVISFRWAVQLHNWVGFVLIANFFIWLGFYLFTDKIKVYHAELSPRKHMLKSFLQLKYYGYGIFKGDPNPHHVTAYDKFNPLQSGLYQIVMLLLVPIQFYTGIMLWDVKRFAAHVDFFGGVRIVDTVHVLIFIFFVAYVLVHAYLGALGPTVTAHYKAMMTGWEDEPDDEEHGDGAASAETAARQAAERA